jgi:GH24 family phage-related lysozyme (muramidase)
MKYLFILVFLFLNNPPLPIAAQKGKNSKSQKITCKRKPVSYYEKKIIAFIKEHEGFNDGYAYVDTHGYKTIGYGHVVKENEVFPERLTRREGEILLMKDFNGAKRMVSHHYPELTGKRKLVLSHLVFCKGIGTVINNEVYKNGQLDSTKLLSMKYPNNRRFEVDLWYE